MGTIMCCWPTCLQVVKVHQSTVDTYLEDIIMGAIDRTAEEQVSRATLLCMLPCYSSHMRSVDTSVSAKSEDITFKI